MTCSSAGSGPTRPLGWFDDPVLSTYLHYSDANLASLIFHELAHEMYYLGGDTVFNESFATTVAREGHSQVAGRSRRVGPVRTRPAAGGPQRGTPAADPRLPRSPADALRERGDAAAKLDLKGELLKDLSQDYDELRARLSNEPGPLRLLPQDPNNAYLAAVGSYNALVPAFKALLRLYDGNLADFYDAVRALGRLPRTQRDLRVAELSTPAVEATASSHETPTEDQAQEG
ncbi:MAG: aminopeptidase [Gammaproteobacteria bacterium]|nr:aminopeptidase [Gammaproteobacteria bacterium]